MSLDLRNFVNVKINYNQTNITQAERGIVTLITVNANYSADPFKEDGTHIVFHSAQEFKAAKKEQGITDESLDVFIDSFFGNKGRAIQIIGGFQGGEEDDQVDFIVSVLETLDYHHVIVVSDVAREDILRKAASQNATEIVVQNDVTNPEGVVSKMSGLNEKMFIASTRDTSGNLYDKVPQGESAPAWLSDTYFEFNGVTGQFDLLSAEPADWSTNYFDYFQQGDANLPNFVIKVGEKGIEMLAAAYLSKARVDDMASLQDYAFTQENVTSYFSAGSIVTENAIGVNLIQKHFNFDSRIANQIRNFPGDTITGADMMNYYIRILMTQDLSEGILNLLASKIRFNQSGLNRVSNAIAQVMNAYIDNGFLDPEFVWTGDDIVYSFNGVNYLVCARNTPLVKGYKASLLPLTSLTREQRESHALPPVYIVFADQTGIRSVLIEGDLF